VTVSAGGRERRPVEGVGRPVRREVGAVAPDRPGLLAAAGEVLALAERDVLGGEEHLAGRGDHARRDRRLVLGDLRASEDEDAECGDDDEQEDGAGLVAHGRWILRT